MPKFAAQPLGVKIFFFISGITATTLTAATVFTSFLTQSVSIQALMADYPQVAREISAAIDKTLYATIALILATAGGIFWALQRLIVRPLRQLATTMTPAPVNSRNEIGRLVASFQEISQREQKLQHALAQLQQTHDELKRTKLQLYETEKMASIGQLAAGVAHEINNPMGFISSNMEVLEQYVSDYGKVIKMAAGLKESIQEENLSKAKSIADEMTKLEAEINLVHIMHDVDSLLAHNHKGIERIHKIVTNLRTFARENRDASELVKIEDIIEAVLTIIQGEIRHKAEFKKTYADTPFIQCNPQQLGQVFINLFLNAIEAIEEKGTIEITTYRDSVHLCVDIHDTGRDFKQQDLDKIFDPFSVTTSPGREGGLGLGISQEIVRKHGGEIRVRSHTDHRGTTFTVRLPISTSNSQ